MRVAARQDYDRCLAVLAWPLREALVTYIERERERVAEDYRTHLLAWAALRPHLQNPKPPPPLPEILQDP